MKRRVSVVILLIAIATGALLQWHRSGVRVSAGSSRNRQNAGAKKDAGDLRIKAWHFVAELDAEVAQFETVFWEPNDTDSLRAWLSGAQDIANRRVLDIGTGTGLLALTCAKLGASSVLATDINPSAVANANYNAEHLGLTEKIEVRRVPEREPGPFSVVRRDELFDWIISNPPWEDHPVREVAAHAFYDPGFELLDGLLRDAGQHLRPGGQLLLVFGGRTAIDRIQRLAPQLGWSVEVADDRELEQLPEVFLPGVLLVLERQLEGDSEQ